MRTPACDETDAAVHPVLAWSRRGFVLILAGYLLFAHGCHGGDHDDELFTSAVAAVAGGR